MATNTWKIRENLFKRERRGKGKGGQDMNMKLRESIMRNETMFCTLCSAEIPRWYVIYQTLRSSGWGRQSIILECGRGLLGHHNLVQCSETSEAQEMKHEHFCDYQEQTKDYVYINSQYIYMSL